MNLKIHDQSTATRPRSRSLSRGLLLRGLLAAALLVIASPAISDTHEQIRRAVHAAVMQHARSIYPDATVQVTPPSARLRLQKCQQPPQVTLPRTARLIGAVNATARCNSPRWQVTVRAQVNAEGMVLISKRSLARGEMITADDVELVARSLIREPHDVIDDAERAIGRRTRRPMSSGTTVNEGALSPRVMVKSGQTIIMEAGKPGFTVSAEGIALLNGDRGDLIRARNLSSGTIVQVQVTDFGTARVVGH